MSAWDEARLGGRQGQRFALGLWDPRHKMASLGWMPPASERKKVFGRVRYSYVLNFTELAVNEVQNDRFTVTRDFYWTDTAASFDLTGEHSGFVPFSAQLFDSTNERRFMDFPLFADNLCGVNPTSDDIVPHWPLTNLQFPYFHRRITRIVAGTALLLRVQNLLGPVPAPDQTINVQIVLGGYS